MKTKGKKEDLGFTSISLHDLRISKTNPRKTLNDDDLKELSESIKAVGIINPITVRKIDKAFEIVSGERRYRAALKAGLETIPVFIKELTDEQVMEIQIIENLQRVDIHPLYEAQSFNALMQKGKYTKEKLAGKLGKSNGYITKRLQLLNLSEEIQERFISNEINFTQALIISRFSLSEQDSILGIALSSSTIEMFRNRISSRYVNLNTAPFDIDDADLKPEAGSCTYCIKRTGVNVHLFDDMNENLCTDQECFTNKIQLHIQKACKADPELIAVSTSYSPQDETLPEVPSYRLKEDSEGIENPVKVIVKESSSYDGSSVGKVFFVERRDIDFKNGEDEAVDDNGADDADDETGDEEDKIYRLELEAFRKTNTQLVYTVAERIADLQDVHPELFNIFRIKLDNEYLDNEIVEHYGLNDEEEGIFNIPDEKVFEVFIANELLYSPYRKYHEPKSSKIRELALEFMSESQIEEADNLNLQELQKKSELELEENE